jgi:hypothetical protein
MAYQFSMTGPFAGSTQKAKSHHGDEDRHDWSQLYPMSV